MTLVVAHRGASAAFPPGNTVEAFAGAVAELADWVELDVHLTADREVIVHHDPVLADGRIIGELTCDELPSFIPTLSVALEACAGLCVNVEIKPDGLDELRPLLIDQVIEVLSETGKPDNYLVTSFDHDIVGAVRAAAPQLPTGLLMFEGSLDEVLDRAVAVGHRAINPWAPLVDHEFVRRAHSLGIAVNVWTVDDPDQIKLLHEIGVDAIITNTPRRCRDILSECQ